MVKFRKYYPSGLNLMSEEELQQRVDDGWDDGKHEYNYGFQDGLEFARKDINIQDVPLITPGDYEHGDMLRNQNGDLLICFDEKATIPDNNTLVCPIGFYILYLHRKYTDEEEEAHKNDL